MLQAALLACPSTRAHAIILGNSLVRPIGIGGAWLCASAPRPRIALPVRPIGDGGARLCAGAPRPRIVPLVRPIGDGGARFCAGSPRPRIALPRGVMARPLRGSSPGL